MTQYDNTNKGVLFRDDNRKSDNHPTHTGSINIDGKEYYLNAWENESKNGRKYFSLKVNPKESKEEAPPQDQPAQAQEDFEDVPF